MSKTFRPYEPEQMLLILVSLRDWLPENYLAYFLPQDSQKARGRRGIQGALSKHHLKALDGTKV